MLLKCFIFAHSHSVAQRASVFLNARGWSNTLLSGKMEQASRTQAWEQLVTKETNILVATGTYFIQIDAPLKDIKIFCGNVGIPMVLLGFFISFKSAHGFSKSVFSDIIFL